MGDGQGFAKNLYIEVFVVHQAASGHFPVAPYPVSTVVSGSV